MILAKLKRRKMKVKVEGTKEVLAMELMEINRGLYRSLMKDAGTEVADKIFDAISDCKGIEDNEEARKRFISDLMIVMKEENKHAKATDQKES